MVNFGRLTAEICWRVWGTPANFNRFRIFAALLHSTVVVCISQTVALNRGRHLYSAGQPPRWALAHILVLVIVSCIVVVAIVVSLYYYNAVGQITKIASGGKNRWKYPYSIAKHSPPRHARIHPLY